MSVCFSEEELGAEVRLGPCQVSLLPTTPHRREGEEGEVTSQRGGVIFFKLMDIQLLVHLYNHKIKSYNKSVINVLH